MPRINYDALRNRRGAYTGAPRTPNGDGFAISAAGRAAQARGEAVAKLGRTVYEIANDRVDRAAEDQYANFNYQENYLKAKTEAVRTGTMVGFRDRVASDYDEKANAFLNGVGGPLVRSRTERLVRSNRQAFLNDATEAEGKALLQATERTRDSQLAEFLGTFNYAPRLLELQKANSGEPPAEFSERVREDYLTFVEEQVEGIDDPEVRRQARNRLISRLPNITSAALGDAAAQEANAASARVDTVLDSLSNQVRSDATSYGEAVENLNALIDTVPGLSQFDADQMKRAGLHELTYQRFEGLLDAATEDRHFEKIEADLHSPGFRDALDPKQFNNLLDSIRIRKAGGRKKLAQNVRSALAPMKKLIADGFPVPGAQLRQLSDAARTTNDADLQQQIVDLNVQNDTILRYQGQPLSVIRRARQEKERALTAGGGTGGVRPVELQRAIPEAAGTDVSQNLLWGIVNFEYGHILKPGEGTTDFTKGTENGSTSAAGPYQFTSGTWNRVTSLNFAAFPELHGLSAEERLKLRGDPAVAARAAAAYARMNRHALKRALGRDPTDTELVTAHFLGAGGAAKFIKALETDPSADAQKMFPTEAKNNPWMQGQSLRQVANTIHERSIQRAGGRGDHVTVETLRKLEARVAQQLKVDPLTGADQQGIIDLVPMSQFTPEEFEQRAAQAQYVQGVQDIPIDDMKVFTSNEVQALQTWYTAEERTLGDKMDFLVGLQDMGTMAEPAYRQLGEVDPLFQYVGQMVATTHDRPTGLRILRGQKRIEDGAKVFGADTTEKEVRAEFDRQVGVALIDTGAVDEIYEAAKAYLAGSDNVGERRTVRAMRQAVNAVTGGNLDTVNGRATLLPRGVEGHMVERLTELMTPEQWSAISSNGMLPVTAEGEAVPTERLEDAQLLNLGGGLFGLMLGGRRLYTGEGEDGNAELFTFKMDAQSLAAMMPKGRG